MTRIKLLLPAVAAVILACSNLSDNETSLEITNRLSGVMLSEAYLENDSTNLLEHQIEPGETLQVTIPRESSAVTAVDENGGIYSLYITLTDSTERCEVDVSIEDRMVFVETIESSGEYWTGTGAGVIRVTNALTDCDIYSLRVTSPREDIETSPDRLQAFILFPGRTANVRVDSGRYNLTALDADHNEYRRESVSIMGKGSLFVWEVTQEDLRVNGQTSGTGSCRLILRNSLDDWMITGIHVRPEGESDWGENNLSPNVVEPGERFCLSLDQGSYDIRVEDEDGDTYTRMGIQLTPAGAAWNVSLEHLDPFLP
jgi:hypothetical protein